MRNYNEEFLKWLERVKELDPKSHDDLPEELQKEFEKLMLLASIPFCHIYGEDPEAMSELLLVCLTEQEYYAEDGSPLRIVMIEEGKTFTSPVNHLVAQPVLYAEDLTRQGQQIMRMDPAEESAPPKRTRKEWKEQGFDPDQPDPNMSKWHTIFFNAAMVS